MLMKFRLFLLLTILLSSSHGLCFAKELTLEEQSDLALEVFQMSQSLDQLSQQLKAQQSSIDENQKLQAAIAYLSFRSRSIEMMQYELRFKKERREALEKIIVRLKEELDSWGEDEVVLQTNNQQVAASDNRKKEARLKSSQQSVERLNSEIVKLENEIQASKDDLASFETYVQERLNLIK
jgi:predicted RNase H-like nuclease (RuvC/YqgF family)